MAQNHFSGKQAALLIIDMINPLNFSKGPMLLEEMRKISDPLTVLINRARKSGLSIIYVNDNAGRWQSEKNYIIQQALAGPAKTVIEKILPASEDYFVIKPKHSGFFATPLQAFLAEREIRTLILTGVAGNICVLFTANDAFMRGYKLIVPRDCCASNVNEDNVFALQMMENVLGADTRAQEEIDFSNFETGSMGAESDQTDCRSVK